MYFWNLTLYIFVHFYIPFFIHSYFIINNKASCDLQKAMKHCKMIWNEYYILKMDVRKYFDNINKDILYKILESRIKDKKLLWLLGQIIYSSEGKCGLAIGYSN